MPGVLFLPNLLQKQWHTIWPDGYARPVATKEVLNPESLPTWIDEQVGEPLTGEQINHLRLLFSPEIVVPATFTVRQPLERHTDSGLTDYLLDYNQEQALKLDLALPDGGQAAATVASVRFFQAKL